MAFLLKGVGCVLSIVLLFISPATSADCDQELLSGAGLMPAQFGPNPAPSYCGHYYPPWMVSPDSATAYGTFGKQRPMFFFLGTDYMLELDLLVPHNLTRLGIRGGHECVYWRWIKQYYLEYSGSGGEWTRFPAGTDSMAGNTGGSSFEYNDLSLVAVRYLRLIPSQVYRLPVLNLQLYGCPLEAPVVSPADVTPASPYEATPPATCQGCVLPPPPFTADFTICGDPSWLVMELRHLSVVTGVTVTFGGNPRLVTATRYTLGVEYLRGANGDWRQAQVQDGTWSDDTTLAFPVTKAIVTSSVNITLALEVLLMTTETTENVTEATVAVGGTTPAHVCAGLTLHARPASPCPPNYFHRGDSCYRVIGVAMSYANAKKWCDVTDHWVNKAHLVTLGDVEEADFVYGLSERSYLWMGMEPTSYTPDPNDPPRVYDSPPAWTWEWIDGTPKTWIGWYPGNPITHTSYPCALGTDTAGPYWRNKQCHEERYFTCETRATERSPCIWHFVRRFQIAGHDDDTRTDVRSVQDCLQLCVVAGAQCVSVEYDRGTDTCVLSTASRATPGVTFVNLASANLDYFEKYCETECDLPLVWSTQNFTSRLSASTHSADMSKDQAFLGNMDASYVPLSSSDKVWYQVEFAQLVKVQRIRTSGNVRWNCYVKSYYLLYSNTTVFEVLRDHQGNYKKLHANYFPADFRNNYFSPGLVATTFRFQLKEWSSKMCLQFEMYGCPLNATPTGPPPALGMESGDIMAAQLSASSVYITGSDHYPPWSARLNHHLKVHEENSWWRPATTSVTEWLQIDLLVLHNIQGIALQGDPVNQWYMKAYELQYATSMDYEFETYLNNDTQSTMEACLTHDTPTLRLLQPELVALRVRIVPQQYVGYSIVRLELYGHVLPCPALPPAALTISAQPAPHCSCRPGLCLSGHDWVELNLTLVHHVTGVEVSGAGVGPDALLEVLYWHPARGWVNVTSAYTEIPQTREITPSGVVLHVARPLTTWRLRVAVTNTSSPTACAVFSVMACRAQACPPGYAEFEDQCFQAFSVETKPSDTQAWETVCARTHWRGAGHVGFPRNREQGAIIFSLARRYGATFIGYCWVNATKDPEVLTAKPGFTWRTVTGERIPYFLWDGDGTTGQPDDVTSPNTQQCAIVAVNSLWNYVHDVASTDSRPYVCQVPASVPSPSRHWTSQVDVTMATTTPVTSITTLTSAACLYACLTTPTANCTAVNYHTSTRQCKLLQETRSTVLSLTASTGWDYYEHVNLTEECLGPLVFTAEGAVQEGLSLYNNSHTEGRGPGDAWLWAENSWFRPVSHTSATFIRVVFPRTMRIRRLVTRGGGHDQNTYVTEFRIMWSNGTAWQRMRTRDGTTLKLNQGNWNNNDPNYVNFDPELIAKMVQFHTMRWTGGIGVRFEFYGCPIENLRGEGCVVKVMATGAQDDHTYSYIRIDGGNRGGDSDTINTGYGIWTRAFNVSAVQCKPLGARQQFDTYNSLTASQELVDWVEGLPNGTWVAAVTRYAANAKLTQHVKDYFRDVHNVHVLQKLNCIYCKAYFVFQKGVRVSPVYEQFYYANTDMLMDTFDLKRNIYECDCELGMKSWDISTSQIHAPDDDAGYGNPRFTRHGIRMNSIRLLNTHYEGGYNGGAASSAWVMVDLLLVHRVTGIHFRGIPTHNYWVSKLAFHYGTARPLDLQTHVDEEGNEKVYDVTYQGNEDLLKIKPTIRARYLKLSFIAWYLYRGYAFELRGCPEDLDQIPPVSISTWAASRDVTPDEAFNTSVPLAEPVAPSSDCPDSSLTCVTWCVGAEVDEQSYTVDLKRMHLLTSVRFYSTTNSGSQLGFNGTEHPTIDSQYRTALSDWKDGSKLSLERFVMVSANASTPVYSLQWEMAPTMKVQYLRLATSDPRLHGQCLHVALHGTVAPACPPGAVQFRASCYLQYGLRQSQYTDAQHICRQFTWQTYGHPVTIDDKDEMDLLSLMESSFDSQWVWTDFYRTGAIWNTTYGQTNNLPWNWGQPNANHICATFKDGKLDDTSCTGLYNIICETEAALPPVVECLPEWALYPSYELPDNDLTEIHLPGVGLGECMSYCQIPLDGNITQGDVDAYQCGSVQYKYSRGAGQCFLKSKVENHMDKLNYVGSTWYHVHRWQSCTRCNQSLVDELYDSGSVLLDASTTYNSYLTPTQARFSAHYSGTPNYGCWRAATANDRQWIRVQFSQRVKVFAIVTQGGAAYGNYYIKTYRVYIRSSIGTYSPILSQDGIARVFIGNNGQYRRHTNALEASVVSDAFIINPVDYNVIPVISFELRGCYTDDPYTVGNSLDENSLGISTGEVSLSQMQGEIAWTGTYGSQYYYSPDGARLNLAGDDGSIGFQINAFIMRTTGVGLTVDLLINHTITSVILQGTYFQPRDYHRITYTYSLEYSADGEDWNFYLDADNQSQALPGNFEEYGLPVRAVLERPVVARYVRVTPLTFYSKGGFRVELVGRPHDCPRMYYPSPEVPVVPTHEATSPGAFAAFPGLTPAPTSAPWCALPADPAPHVQIDLGLLYLVTSLHFLNGTTLQQYTLNTSVDGVEWTAYMLDMMGKPVSQVLNLTAAPAATVFPRPVRARALRLTAIGWDGPAPCVALHVHGCRADACPPHFVQHGAKCYYLANGSSTPAQAAAVCARAGWAGPGRLLAPTDYRQLGFTALLTLRTADKFLTSLHKEGGVWQWGDGQPLVGRGPWESSSEPAASDDCAYLRHDSYMALIGHPCSTLLGTAFCQTDASVVPDAPLLRWAGYRNIQLIGPITYRSLTNLNLTICLFYCQDDVTCLSIQYKTTTRTCSMFNVTHLSPGNHQFYYGGYNYYWMKYYSPESDCDIPLLHTVADEQITAKTEYSALYPAHNSRIFYNFTDGYIGDNIYWKATSAVQQWIQVDLLTVHPIHMLSIQSGYSAEDISRPRRNHLLYATDRAEQWEVYSLPDPTQHATFQVRHYHVAYDYPLEPRILARYVRLHVIESSATRTALHWQLWGCPAINYTTARPACYADLGMESGAISDSMIRADKHWWYPTGDQPHPPYAARLNSPRPAHVADWGWIPYSTASPPIADFIKVDLLVPHTVRALVTQKTDGSGDIYLTQFSIKYSHDGQTWYDQLTDTGQIKIYSGNIDGSLLIFHHVVPPVLARHIGILPVTWNSRPGFKFEVIGCPADCPSLTADAVVKLTASHPSPDCPSLGLLHGAGADNCTTGWCTAHPNLTVQVTMQSFYQITGVTVHILPGGANLTSPTIEYTSDAMTWTRLNKTSDIESVGTDFGKIVLPFTRLVKATIIRLIIEKDDLEDTRSICLEVEVKACKASACPPGFAHQGASCYHVQHVHMTQADAERQCSGTNWVDQGHLVSIDGAEENAFLQELIDPFLPAYKAYHDLTYNSTSSEFCHPPSDQVATYYNWISSQPSSPATHSCSRISPGAGFWYSAACTQQYSYICELKAAGQDKLLWHFIRNKKPDVMTSFQSLSSFNFTECLQYCEEAVGCGSVVHQEAAQLCLWSARTRYVGGLTFVTAAGSVYAEKLQLARCEQALVGGALYSMAISVSSESAPSQGKQHVVMGTHPSSTGGDGYWQPQPTDTQPWIQFEFMRRISVSHVAVQGSNTYYAGVNHNGKYVTAFTMSFTPDNVEWVNVSNSATGNDVFEGNTDYHSVVYHYLSSLPIGVAFRFDLLDWATAPSVKLELYGCPFKGVEDCYTTIAPELILPGTGVLKPRCIEGSTIILQVSDSQTMARSWDDYRVGFGSLSDNYWLGNLAMFYLTSRQHYQLRVDLWTADGEYRHSEFRSIILGDGGQGFPLEVSGYRAGPAGEGGLTSRLFGAKFHTYDVDNVDTCALQSVGGWWYNPDTSDNTTTTTTITTCFSTKLTGVAALPGGQVATSSTGLFWETEDNWSEDFTRPLAKVIMRMRPIIASVNVAAGKPAYQSSTIGEYVADHAVDSDNNNDMSGTGLCTMTLAESSAWWLVDLQKQFLISGISIVNRGDCCGSRLNNFAVKVGSTFDAMSGTVTSSAFNLCKLFSGVVGDGVTISVPCTRQVAGQYVLIEKTDGTPLTLCEVEVLTYIESGPMYSPCTWDEECHAEFTECSALDPGTLASSWTCQCQRYYTERQGVCLPAADITPRLPLVTVDLGTHLVRAVPATLTIHVNLLNAIGTSFHRNDSVTNFNLTAVLTDESGVNCDLIFTNCSVIHHLHLDTTLADISTGIDVTENVTLEVTAPITIDPNICHRIALLCVSVRAEYWSSYVELNPDNNKVCRDIRDTILCQPDVDVQISAVQYTYNIPVVRDYMQNYTFEATLQHSNGIYGIAVLNNTYLRNYHVYYTYSAIYRNNATILLEDATITQSALTEPADTQRGMFVTGNMGMPFGAPVDFTKADCDKTIYLCVVVVADSTASYRESDPDNNIHCLNITEHKLCDPEIEVVPALLNIPNNWQFIRGYNMSFTASVYISNKNQTFDIVPVLPPSENLAITLVLSSDDLQVLDASYATNVYMRVSVSDIDKLQPVPANGSSTFSIYGGQLLVPRAVCGALSQMCVDVRPAAGASYRLPVHPSTHSHINCQAASTLLNCIGLAIQNVTFDVDESFIVTGTTISFSISWLIGTDVEFNIDFGDGDTYMWNWNNEGHVTSYMAHTVHTEHTFNVHGNYSVTLNISNDVGFELLYHDVVIEPILDAHINLGVDYLPDATPVYFAISITPVHSDNVFPILITCSVDYGDNVTIESMHSINQSVILIYHIYEIDVPDESLQVHCINHFSDVHLQRRIILRQAVLNLAIVQTQQGFATNTSASFAITISNGSHIRYDLDYGEGTLVTLNDTRLSYLQAFVANHTYTTAGNYTVSVRAWNEHFNASTELIHPVLIQIPVQDLTAFSPDVVAVPPGTATFRLNPNPSLPAPTDVFCSWSLAPGHHEDNYAHRLTNNLDEQREFTYDVSHVGPNITVNLSCHNLVSSEEFQRNVVVQEVLTGMIITFDPPIVTPGNETKTIISFSTGSHTKITIQTGDGAVIVGTHPYIFANIAPFIATYSYSQIGNYSLSILAENQVSNQSSINENDVIVQNEVLALELNSSSAILWPAGDIEFTLYAGIQQAPLGNLHCFWTFGDGSDRYHYIPLLDWSNSVTIPHTYSRNDEGVVDITVNCSNLISWQKLTTQVDVIVDEVILDSLVNVRPVLWSNVSVLVLNISRFGTDSCFIFDVGDGHNKAAYGVEACRHHYQLSGLQFNPVDPRSTPVAHYIPFEIKHSFTYATIGSFTVTVTAFNAISETQLNTTAVVLDWPCYLPKVTLPDNVMKVDAPLVYMKSQRFEILGNFFVNCSKTQYTNLTWTVYRIGYEAEGAAIDVQRENRTYTHQERYLPYGRYVIHFNVSMYTTHPILIVPGMFTVHKAYIEITKTPLVVSMVHGEEFELQYNRTTEVNAQYVTFDLDVEPADKSGMKFKWFCRWNDTEEFPMEGGVLWDSPPTPSPGQVADPLRGYGGCFGDGPGLLPNPTGMFRLNTFYMMVTTQYIIRVEVYKDDRFDFFEQNFFVGQSDPPIVKITCRENCLQKKRWSGRIILKSVCSEMCSTKFGTIYHTWRLFKLDSITHNETEVADLPAISPNGIHKASLFIEPSSLEPMTWYVARVYASTPGSPNGTNTHTFLTNRPPYDGNCVLGPKAGIAAQTLFYIECPEWKEWNPINGAGWLRYEFRIKSCGAKRSFLFHFGDSPTSKPVFFPVGNPVQQFCNNITLYIVDSIGDYSIFQIKVTVYPPPRPKDHVANEMLAIANGDDPKLTDAIKTKDYQRAVNIIFAATSILNVPIDFDIRSIPSHLRPNTSLDTFVEETEEYMIDVTKKRVEARTHFINFAVQLPVDGLDTLSQSNEVMFYVLQNVEEVSIDAQETSISRVDYLSGAYVEMKTTMTPEQTRSMAEDIVLDSVQLLEAGYIYSSRTLLYERQLNDSGATPKPKPETTTTSGTWLSAELRVKLKRQRASSVMEKTVDIMDDIVTSLQDDMEPGDPSVDLHHHEVSLLVSVERAQSISERRLASTRGSIKIPTIEMIDFANQTKEDCIKSKAMFSKINPFIRDVSADEVRSAVVDFAIVPCHVTLDPPSKRRRRRRAVPEVLNQDVFELELAQDMGEPVRVNGTPIGLERMLYHAINLTEPVKPVQITVVPLDNQTRLNVYVRVGEAPTADVYDWNMSVPLSSSADDSTSGQTDFSLFSIYIAAANLSKATTYESLHIGVQHQDINDREDVLIYDLYIKNSDCQSYDASTDTWSSANCQMEPSSNPAMVRFKSNLFGSFGAGLFVPPNTIDFGSVFDNFAEKLVENAPVVATLVTVLLLYIPLLFLCRWFDKKDIKKWLCLPLVDNSDSDTQRYELHVYTGFKSNAETKSNIYFHMHGTKGDTGIRKLNDGVRENFKRCEVNSFMMAVPESLGTPHTLDIWHDNSGQGKLAGWFLSKIVVIDKQEHKWYLFVCDNWLALDSGDGRLHRRLVVTYSADGSDSNVLLQQNLTRSLYDDHIWLSVGYRKTRSTFSRVQRLTCCMAILFLAMVTNAMWFGTEDVSQAKQAITLGPISFTVHEIFTSFMSSLVLVPPVLVITLLFSKAAPKPTKHEPGDGEAGPRVVRPRGTLPHWCRYVAWVLVAITIALAAFFTLLYSFEFGGAKSRAWLSAFFLCFFESVLLIQPLKAILFAILLTFLFKKDTDISEYESKLGKMDTSISDSSNIRAPKQSIPVHMMLNNDEAEAFKKRQLLDTKMRLMVREVVFYLAFLFLLILVINTNQNSNVYWQNASIKNNFLTNVTKIGMPADVWGWMRAVVVPNLYYTANYRGDVTLQSDHRFLSDTYSFRLGPPRLRMLRVRPGNCSVVAAHPTEGEYRCTEWYSMAREDHLNYTEGWQEQFNSTQVNWDTLGSAQKAFHFKSQQELKGAFFWGYMQWYSGGGYVANLGNSEEEALAVIQELEETEWVDKYTRVFFLEFSVWNPNTNLFNLVIISLEFEPVGGMFMWNAVDSVQLYRYSGTGGVVNLFIEIGCIIFALISFFLEIRKLVKDGRAYFQSAWSILLLVALVLFLVAFAMYVVRSMWTIWKVEEMMNNRDKSVNFQPVALYNLLFLTFFGLTTFLVQMQLLHLLRYNKTICLFGTTLAKSASDLLDFACVSGLIFMAFALSANINFNKLEHYSSVTAACTTLTSSFLGKFSFYELVDWFGIFGGYFLLSYLLTMMVLILNVFIVILNDYLAAVKADKNAAADGHEVIDHFIGVFKTIIGVNKKDLKNAAKESSTKSAVSKPEKVDFDDLGDRIDQFWQMAHAYETSVHSEAMEILVDHIFNQTISDHPKNTKYIKVSAHTDETSDLKNILVDVDIHEKDQLKEYRELLLKLLVRFEENSSKTSSE